MGFHRSSNVEFRLHPYSTTLGSLLCYRSVTLRVRSAPARSHPPLAFRSSALHACADRTLYGADMDTILNKVSDIANDVLLLAADDADWMAWNLFLAAIPLLLAHRLFRHPGANIGTRGWWV